MAKGIGNLLWMVYKAWWKPNMAIPLDAKFGWWPWLSPNRYVIKLVTSIFIEIYIIFMHIFQGLKCILGMVKQD